jgi:hypothetical protein
MVRKKNIASVGVAGKLRFHTSLLARLGFVGGATAGLLFAFQPNLHAQSSPLWFEMLPQNSRTNRFFGFEYGINSRFGLFLNRVRRFTIGLMAISYANGEYVYPGSIFDRLFDVYSFAGMPVAAAYTMFTFAPPGYYR